MTYNESDDKLEIQNEIRILEEEIVNLDTKSYFIAIKKKMLRHRVADLKYILKHPEYKDLLFKV